ncbi:MAG: glycosyltransferase [Gemmatimonadota bacterium]|nr:glycosyltransferase [Gemmatimonadota bacterium]
MEPERRSIPGTPLVGRNEDATRRIHAALARVPRIVCFANDWRGDPTSKHHIMRIFSQVRPVEWIEASGMRRPNLASRDDWGRIGRKVWGRFRRAPRPETPSGAVRVHTPLTIPVPGNALANGFNRGVYRRLLGSFSENGAQPLHWVYTPTMASQLEVLGGGRLVYHCVDRWWEFSEYETTLMRRYHDDLCRSASVVFASASELLADCLPLNPNSHLIRHGVDWSHFAGSVLSPAAEEARPPDLEGISGPVIGFWGLIHDWVDVEAIADLARACPDATLVLIGSVRTDVSPLSDQPNVRMLGQKPYAALPRYARFFDVALVPFRVNELTRAVNPIKLREYLSAGIPVVATRLPEVEAMGFEGLFAYEGSTELVHQVRGILEAGRTPEGRTALAYSMETESWAFKCAEMAELAVGGTGRVET